MKDNNSSIERSRNIPKGDTQNLPKGWVETTLGEVCEIKYGKDHKHLVEGNIPCFGSGGLMRNVDKVLYNKPSVLIPRKGTLSNLFYIDVPFWTVDTLFYTKIDEKQIEPIFLYFKLKTYNLENLNVGSAVPSLTTAVLNQFPFIIPQNIEEQKAIAKILTAFDDKIELLQAQNKTLESIAQTIFKEWFGKYQIGDELPEGWRVGKYDDLVNLSSGKGVKKSEYIDDGKYKIIGANGVLGKINKFLINENIIITGRVGTLGTVFIIKEPVWLSDNVLISKPKFNNLFYYTYFTLKTFNFKSLNSGSTQPLITQNDLKLVPVLIPDNNTLQEFEILSESVFVKIQSNNSQIQTLQQTRDTLLPKLMSGQLRVNEFKE